MYTDNCIIILYALSCPLLAALVVSVHFEKSEYFGREVADSESTVEYAVVVDGEFEVNFTVAVETEDGTARGTYSIDEDNK